MPVTAGSDLAAARSVFARSDLLGDYRTQPADHTWEELEQAQQQLDALVAGGAIAPERLRTWLDSRSNTAAVEVASTIAPDELQVLKQLVSRLGGRADIRETSESEFHAHTLGCSAAYLYKYCDTPLRGGVGIDLHRDIEYLCTAGFRARGDNGRRYLLSAGHCFAGSNGSRVFWDSMDGGVNPSQSLEVLEQHLHFIGPLEHFNFPTHDWGKIDATSQEWDTVSWPARVVYWGENTGTVVNENYGINSEDSAVLFETVCHSGATTGTSCAPVINTHTNVFIEGSGGGLVYNENRAYGGCAFYGDSGGPVFHNGKALGLVSAGEGLSEEHPCNNPYWWFVDIREATEAMNVKIAPLSPISSQTTLNISRPSASVVRASGTVKHDSVPIQANQVTVNFYRSENGQWALRNSVQAPVNNGSYQAPDVSISDGSWRITTTFPGNEMFSASDSNTITISPPTVETKPATNIQEGQATLNGTVNPNGKETTYRFEYGKTTSYGNSIPVPNAGAGAGTSPVTVYLTPNTLLPRTRYHFRLVATNSDGTSYGADRAFTTGVKWIVRNSNSSGNPQVMFWFGLPGETRVSGDWDGNGTDTPGAYNPSTGVWKLRNSTTTGPAFTTFQYGGGPWTTPVVGDWNGDGKDTVGVFDPVAGNWNLRDSNSEGPPTYSFQYGGGPWTKPVVGDWNNDGKDTIGVYDPQAGNWNLRDTLTFGTPTYSFQYGGGPWSGALAGDWNGDGIDSIGVFDPVAGNWNLRNSNGSGPPDYSFQYGGSQYQFTVGDWDGNGTETPALSEANATTAIEYQLRNKNETGNPEIIFESGTPDQEPLAGDWNADGITTTGRYEPLTGIWRLRPNNLVGIYTATEFQYGGSQFKPVVGDWNGDKTETIGLFEPIAGRWELRNENSAGVPQLDFVYGGSQFTPVVGDWNGDGKDTIGVFEPISGQWYLRDTNSAGPADYSFQYGGSQFTPVVGDWNGDGKDTIGLYEPIAGQWYLRNTNSAGPSDYGFQYGGSQFKPVAGDWNGDKIDTIGLVTW
ncbi:MAG TPA: S1 family peptidase [Solirubrobacterales bacterium]|nr:S1 family peptidase [Solirubrobacterales bacterium]